MSGFWIPAAMLRTVKVVLTFFDFTFCPPVNLIYKYQRP